MSCDGNAWLVVEMLRDRIFLEYVCVEVVSCFYGGYICYDKSVGTYIRPRPCLVGIKTSYLANSKLNIK